MPRQKKLAPPTLQATPEELALRQAEGDMRARLREAVAQWGAELGEYDYDRLVTECRCYVSQAGEAMLELGRRLIVLREHELHGRWLPTLQLLDIQPRAAQKLMQAAVKFWRPNAPTLAHLGRAKLLELATVDDETIEALEKGTTLTGLKLDDIDRMSVREARAALRKERQARRDQAEAQERRLQELQGKVDDLAGRLDRRDLAGPAERQAEYVAMAEDAARQIWTAMQMRLIPALRAALEEDHLSEAVLVVLRGNLAYLFQELLEINAALGLGASLEDQFTPEWLRQIRGEQDPANAKALSHLKAVS